MVRAFIFFCRQRKFNSILLANSCSYTFINNNSEYLCLYTLPKLKNLLIKATNPRDSSYTMTMTFMFIHTP